MEAPRSGSSEDGIVGHALRFSPCGKYLAVAANEQVRVFGWGGSGEWELLACKEGVAASAHQSLIRSLAWNTSGQIVATAADDKWLKLWKTDSVTGHYHLLASRLHNKKISAVAFGCAAGGQEHVLYADKFGEVHSLPVEQVSTAEPVLLLGHLSIVTDLVVSPAHDFIITADRDEKIRVSHFPYAYDIQAFCLGHTQFVSKLAAITSSLSSTHLLVSGSGDGTLRLWDYVNGTPLFKCQVEGICATSIPAAYHSASNVLVALMEGVRSLYLYRLVVDGDKHQLQSLTTLVLDSAPIDATFDEKGNVWVACEQGLQLFVQEKSTEGSITYSEVGAVPRHCMHTPFQSLIGALKQAVNNNNNSEFLTEIRLARLRKRSDVDDVHKKARNK